MCQTMKMSERNKQVFLDGLKKYQSRGIPVLVDGKKAEGNALEKIFEQDEDGFYMGDYILEENRIGDHREPPPFSTISAVYEPHRGYTADLDKQRFHLKEIRFDKVYHR